MSFTLFSVRFLLYRVFAELVVTAAIGDILYRPFHQNTRMRATAKKPTSAKTAHPVETPVCYNILLHQWDLQRF